MPPETVTGTAQETPARKDAQDDRQEEKREERPSEKPAAKTENGKPPMPGPGNPRFDQVYARWKDAEKDLALMKQKQKEADEAWELAREHNRKLEAEVEEIKRTKADRQPDPEPDFDENPGEWRKWKAHQEALREKAHAEELEATRRDTLLAVEKRLHPDYVEMAKIAQRDVDKDPELQKRIYNADNPFAEAYEYGKRKSEEMKQKLKEESEREENREKIDVEKGGGHEDNDEGQEEKLNDQERAVAHRLFSDLDPEKAEAKYYKQKKAMGR